MRDPGHASDDRVLDDQGGRDENHGRGTGRDAAGMQQARAEGCLDGRVRGRGHGGRPERRGDPAIGAGVPIAESPGQGPGSKIEGRAAIVDDVPPIGQRRHEAHVARGVDQVSRERDGDHCARIDAVSANGWSIRRDGKGGTDGPRGRRGSRSGRGVGRQRRVGRRVVGPGSGTADGSGVGPGSGVADGSGVGPGSGVGAGVGSGAGAGVGSGDGAGVGSGWDRASARASDRVPGQRWERRSAAASGRWRPPGERLA